MRPPRMPAAAPAGADFDPLRGTPPPPVAAPSKVLSADASPSAVVDGLRGVLDALKGALGEFDSTIEALKFTPQGFFWDEVYAKERILATLLADQPPAWRALGQPATRRLEGLVSLCVTAQLDAEPRHPEVLRRLRWFVGSLFMAMPEAPPVEEALSQSTLTPFCAEDILFGMRELVAKNEDGVSVLYFLKTVRPDEQSNTLEPCEQRLFTPGAASRCTRTSGPTSSSGSASRLARRRGSSRRRTSCSSSARGPPSAARP